MTMTIMKNITKMTIVITVMTNMTIIMNDEYIHLSANSAVTMVAMNARSSTTAMEMLDFFWVRHFCNGNARFFWVRHLCSENAKKIMP